MNNTVTLLKNCRGEVLGAWSDSAEPVARMRRYNADPFMSADEPDPDAPYTVETLHVQGGVL